MSALSSPEEGPIGFPHTNVDRRVVFRELESLRRSASSSTKSLESLSTHAAKFSALRDHVRLSLKPFRDYLRRLSLFRGPVTAEQQLVRLLVFERKIQFGFRSTFQSRSHGKAAVNGFSSSQMSSALLANTITPVIFELAFAVVKQTTDSTNPTELRSLTNKLINKHRARRTRYVSQTQALQDQLDQRILDDWSVLFECCQVYHALTEIASLFEAALLKANQNSTC